MQYYKLQKAKLQSADTVNELCYSKGTPFKMKHIRNMMFYIIDDFKFLLCV